MSKTILFFAFIISCLYGAPKSVYSPHVVEDTFVLYALDAQSHQKYHQAAEFFGELHKQTAKKEYLYHSLRMFEYSNDANSLMQRTLMALKAYPEDMTLQRFEIVSLLKISRYGEAATKAQMLSDRSKKSTDYLLLGEAKFKLGDLTGGIEAMQKGYEQSYDNDTAERIALIRYTQFGEKKEAIEFLKKHIGTHGNSQMIGRRLGSMYADYGMLNEAGVMFEQTYDAFKDIVSAEDALKIYTYQQDMTKMSALLEKSGLNDPLLLDIYVKVKAFNKASALAQKLYEQEDNPLYLAQSAVFKYEGAANRKDPALVAQVMEGLKKAVVDLEEPLYLNYLGYLMIDHDLNVSEGMGYVRRALEKQPDSPFYIDSLAWGHYKQNECVEALRLIKQVESMIGTDEQEVKDHLNAIEKCKTKEKN